MMLNRLEEAAKLSPKVMSGSIVQPAPAPISRPTRNCSEGLWCAIQVVGAERSLDALSGDALRHRHTEPGHPVQHRAADPGFGLLGRQSPGAKATTDDCLVAEHGGLSERAPAIADCL